MKWNELIEAEFNIFAALLIIWFIPFCLGLSLTLTVYVGALALTILKVSYKMTEFNFLVNEIGFSLIFLLIVMLLAHVVILSLLKLGRRLNKKNDKFYYIKNPWTYRVKR